MTIRGTAAGVPFVALPPRSGRRLVVAWHLIGTPGTPDEMAAALPLAGVDAWRVYLALPVRDRHGDALVDWYAPVVSRAVARFPAALAALREALPCDDGPVDLVGGSAGGHVALLTAAREGGVRRVAVVNPAVTAEAVVDASVDAGVLEPYEWTPRAKAAAGPLDVLTAADRIGVPLLVVRGEHEYPAFRPSQDALCAAVQGSRLVEVPGLPHMLTVNVDEVDGEVTAWLNG
jgi:pimeloyl-ACP methyl ester carboxylesterase